jgi:7-carboxy-7-deazaguanine synthase
MDIHQIDIPGKMKVSETQSDDFVGDQAALTVPTSSMIYVDELFGPTLEGEGSHLGEPTVYVRTGRCDYACSWCDSKHAVDYKAYQHEWRLMEPESIFQEVQARTGNVPFLVTISGGNPALYSSVGNLIALLHEAGHRVKVETQGSIVQEWFADIDILSLSPKPPSSLMPPLPPNVSTRKALQLKEAVWTKLSACIEKAKHAEIYLKIPILTEDDYRFAKEVGGRYPSLPLYLQPTNADPHGQDLQKTRSDLLEKWAWLAQRVLADQWYGAIVRPQAHVLLWGNKRGV